MFRRIETVWDLTKDPEKEWVEKQWRLHQDNPKENQLYYKQGLMGIIPVPFPDGADWFDGLRGPDRTLPRNCKFYFTELGWNKLGRKIVADLLKHKVQYQVKAIKETDAQVVWRDKHTKYEVAVQPKKPRND